MHILRYFIDKQNTKKIYSKNYIYDVIWWRKNEAHINWSLNGVRLVKIYPVYFSGFSSIKEEQIEESNLYRDDLMIITLPFFLNALADER